MCEALSFFEEDVHWRRKLVAVNKSVFNKNEKNMKDKPRIIAPVPTTIAATYDAENPLPESPFKSEGSSELHMN